jgi:hypothetical protein
VYLILENHAHLWGLRKFEYGNKISVAELASRCYSDQLSQIHSEWNPRGDHLSNERCAYPAKFTTLNIAPLKEPLDEGVLTEFRSTAAE